MNNFKCNPIISLQIYYGLTLLVSLTNIWVKQPIKLLIKLIWGFGTDLRSFFMKLKIVLLKFEMLPNLNFLGFIFLSNLIIIMLQQEFVSRISSWFIFQSAEIGVTLHFPTNDSLFCIIYRVQEVKVLPTCLVYSVFHGLGRVW